MDKTKKKTWTKKKYGFQFNIFFDGDRTTTAVLVTNDYCKLTQRYTDDIIKDLIWNVGQKYHFHGTVRKSAEDDFNLTIASNEAIRKVLHDFQNYLKRELNKKITTLNSMVEG